MSVYQDRAEELERFEFQMGFERGRLVRDEQDAAYRLRTPILSEPILSEPILSEPIFSKPILSDPEQPAIPASAESGGAGGQKTVVEAPAEEETAC